MYVPTNFNRRLFDRFDYSVYGFYSLLILPSLNNVFTHLFIIIMFYNRNINIHIRQDDMCVDLRNI